jgi:ribonuclease HI
MDNSTWLLGDGTNINFWNDSWCGPPLSEHLHIPNHVSQLLTAKVSDFIFNGSWVFPDLLIQAYPNLYSITSQVIIPMEPDADSLLWKNTDDGDLTLKEAYLFKLQQVHDLPWANSIWSSDIPPSKSLLVWRIMHDKVPTDENLMSRGCYIPSICNLCSCHVETTFHLFFECSYAIRLWSWFAGCVNQVLHFSSLEDMWKIADLNWSPQCRVTIIAAIVNLLNTLWLVRNQARFNNKLIDWKSAISLIIAGTALSGNITRKPSSNSIRDFSLLKLFRITIHHPNVPILKEILWHPPLFHWYKCNTDGASNGNPGPASCGGVFRDHNSDFVFAFAEPLGVCSSYFAELSGALRAIEIAFERNWLNLWLESDSTLVVSAFTNPKKSVAWPLRNRWKNALFMISQMNFIVTHTYREGNIVADLIANFGLSAPHLTSWESAPMFISDALEKNKLGMPCFRLCSA